MDRIKQVPQKTSRHLVGPTVANGVPIVVGEQRLIPEGFQVMRGVVVHRPAGAANPSRRPNSLRLPRHSRVRVEVEPSRLRAHGGVRMVGAWVTSTATL